jgi:hypothetical protein
MGSERERKARVGSFLVASWLLASAIAPFSAQAQSSSAPSMTSDQLDKLVAPIALYPDPLVAQILPASTYPVQVIEAERALASGSRPDKQAASAWDPSIQALLSYPTVLKMMSDKINWTTQLGQAVAANQSNVMAAIQRVRHEAQQAGNLQSNDKQLVAVQGSGTTSTIVIEPANPQVIYVPQYNPVTILAPPPPYYAYPPGYGMMTFGMGFAAGAATAYACNWGGYGYGSVTVNNNYVYNRSNNYTNYHPQSGTYTGYDSKTGTYGAYNPSTGKYATYNPSTGAYNKDGTKGTVSQPAQSSYSSWKPQSSSSVGRSTSSYNASQYRAGGTGQSGYRSTAGGEAYRGAGEASGSDGARSFGGGEERGAGGDAFHGLGGGGWGARDASTRGASSFAGRDFGGGGWGGFRNGGGGGGGGFGGFHGFRGGGFRR